MTSPSTDRLRRAATHALAVPALMAVLICLAGAHVAVSFQIPSWANDEAPHVGYVASLAHGDLPTIDSPVIDDWARFPPHSGVLLGWDNAHRDIWTANHPPMYHLLLVPVWWLAADDLSHAVIAMRLVNTLGFGCWVLLVGLIARELVPRRPAAAALATVVAVTPSLTLRSGFLMNDGWGNAAALLTMLMTIRMVRGEADAITGRRVAVAALAGVLAAGTRAPGVLVVAVCSVALLMCLRRDRRRALLAACVVGGVPAVATAWFYLRNLRLYGDLTGQGALLEKFQRSPVESLADLVRVNGVWEPALAAPIPFLVLLTVVPYAVVKRVRSGALRRGWRPDPAWSLLVVHAVLTAANLAGFIRDGGGFHDRYLMTVLPLLATVTALGMLSVGRPVLRAVGGRSADADRSDWRAATAWAAVLLAWLAGAFGYLEWYYVYNRQDRNPLEGTVPVILLVVATAVGVLAVAVMARRAAGTVWHLKRARFAPPRRTPRRPLGERSGARRGRVGLASG